MSTLLPIHSLWRYMLCVIAAMALCYCQPPYDGNVDPITSKTSRNNKAHNNNTVKYNVYVVYSPACPICKRYGLTIDSLYKTFAPLGFNISCVIPEYLADTTQLDGAFYELATPMVIDANGTLLKKLRPTVTPECFVCNDSDGRIIYSGLIDDLPVDVGVMKAQATKHFLYEVLNQLCHTGKSNIASTRAIGCFIENDYANTD